MKYSLFFRFFSIFLLANIFTFANASSKKPDVAASDKHDVKIAVVDVQAVIAESVAVREMQAEITKIGANLEKIMQEKERELKNDEDAIVKKRGKVSEAEFQKNVSEFHEKLTSVQRMMQEKRTRLDKAHADAMSNVQDITMEIVAAIAKERKLGIVMSASNLLYYSNPQDITHDVISRLNSKLKTVPFNY